MTSTIRAGGRGARRAHHVRAQGAGGAGPSTCKAFSNKTFNLVQTHVKLGRRQAAGAIAVLFVNSDEDIFTLDYTDQDVGVEKLISLPFACVASNY